MTSTPKKRLVLRPTREMARQRTPESVSVQEFWGRARGYRKAADELVAVSERSPAPDRHLLRDPINFLYLHTIELVLKAFLRAHGRVISGKLRTHRLSPLYKECRRLGLVVAPNDRGGIAEIVRLLDSGNAGQGFRYFVPGSAQEPAVAWTQEVVAALIQAIEPRVPFSDAGIGGTDELVRGTFTFGKPEPKAVKDER